jgi:hypothetical protein
MKCESEEFIDMLKEYGHLKYEKGILDGKGSTGRGKKYGEICDKTEIKFNEILDKYSPECKCDLEKINIDFEEMVKKANARRKK